MLSAGSERWSCLPRSHSWEVAGPLWGADRYDAGVGAPEVHSVLVNDVCLIPSGPWNLLEPDCLALHSAQPAAAPALSQLPCMLMKGPACAQHWNHRHGVCPPAAVASLLLWLPGWTGARRRGAAARILQLPSQLFCPHDPSPGPGPGVCHRQPDSRKCPLFLLLPPTG